MANIEVRDVVPIDADHCEAVWPLSVEAGWTQNLADWRFMLGAGRGFGCTGPDGKWQASSLILPLGQKLAWISMVLVTKARRRSGLGTGLLKRCIDEVRSAGAVAGLDATEQGRPIYLPLGFRDLYKISRWHFDHGEDTAVRPPAGGKLAGFVLGREGRMATSLGPVVADNEAIALALIAKAVASAPGPFIIDVPEAHRAVCAWLEAQGATTPRGYRRMTLGEAKGLDDPTHLFALAGPELG